MSEANVQTAKTKLGKIYNLGCTGFVADVLGRAQKHSSEWTYGNKVGIDDLSPGDVVGWKANSAGEGEPAHVFIYIG